MYECSAEAPEKRRLGELDQLAELLVDGSRSACWAGWPGGGCWPGSAGMQLWCVVGARETWARAVAAGQWGPFGCSIKSFADTHDPDVMGRALAESAEQYRAAAAGADPADDTRTGFRLDLLEHESQHLGQLLRYLLGLGITPPPGWKARFAL